MELKEELVSELKEELREEYQRSFVERVCKKMRRGISVQDAADMLEEDISLIQEVYDIAADFAPEYDTEKIMDAFIKKIKEKDI